MNLSVLSVLFWFIVIIIISYVFAWLIEFKRCTEEQRKHNEFWTKRGKKPFIDFCKHL